MENAPAQRRIKTSSTETRGTGCCSSSPRHESAAEPGAFSASVSRVKTKWPPNLAFRRRQDVTIADETIARTNRLSGSRDAAARLYLLRPMRTRSSRYVVSR